MSWYLDSDDLLIHDDLPEPIESNLAPPYPASLWRLDSDDVLTLNNEDWSPFPEPLPNFTPPYPATMWYLDEDNKLKNALLPDEPRIPSVYAGDAKIKSIYIGDQLVQSPYIGKILLQLEED